MTNIEQLKQELLTQKSAIEAKGGVVSPAYTNPSPAEITAGINTIPVGDFSLATAAESDVIKGKTFYSVGGTIKTGSLEALDLDTIDILFNNYQNPPISTKLVYNVRAGTTKLKNYFMCHSNSSLDVYLNDELQEIGNYAFDACPNIRIKNFSTAPNLTTIGDYGMAEIYDIDFTSWPSNLTSIGAYSFANAIRNNASVILPSSITSYGKGCFGSKSTSFRNYCGNVDFSNCAATTLPDAMFAGMIGNFEMVTPSTITTVPQQFNFYGCCKAFTITSNITAVKGYVMGFLNTSEPQENLIMESITIEPETPPTFGSMPFGTASAILNAKIYVPDQSLSAYKAISQLKTYTSLMYPISQKP